MPRLRVPSALSQFLLIMVCACSVGLAIPPSSVAQPQVLVSVPPPAAVIQPFIDRHAPLYRTYASAELLPSWALRRQIARDDVADRVLLAQVTAHGIMDYEYSGTLGLPAIEAQWAATNQAAAHIPDNHAPATLQAWNAIYNRLLQVDMQLQAFAVLLKAMVLNLHDSTPYNQVHLTDVSLMQYFGVSHQKVIIVSLLEQTLRAYDNGQLALSTYVTTGRRSRPSPPGFLNILDRRSPTIFISSEPRNSPLWFAPTEINYALLYYPDGDWIHDAWWRTSFGPGTNLPHYDPLAFNGGSHGCVNLPLQPMAQLYAWTPLGTPVIVY